MRRPGDPVRRHDQRLAHQPGDGSDHSVEPLLGVHVPRQLLVQPCLAEPAEVPRGRRLVRRRVVRQGGRAGDHGDGHLHLLRRLPDRADRRHHPQVPPARHRLRQPRRAADGFRPGLRQRRRPRPRGVHHVAHDGNRVQAVRRAGVRRRRVRGLRAEPRHRGPAEWGPVVGAYGGYARNADAHKRVMRKHAAANDAIRTMHTMDKDVQRLATQAWDDVVKLGERYGYRNAQASVLAPTGTIGFMMDCDTTGIEPDFSLVKFKKLVGGGSMQIVNLTIPRALQKLGYTQETIEAVVEYIAEHGHVIDAPGLKPEHYEVFDCAMGARALAPMGHVRMMAAAQPFLSGAISKTVNLPETATVEEIQDVYMQGWKLGIKALAIYRDNCKVGQPLSDGGSTAKDNKAAADAAAAEVKVEKVIEYRPVRRRLPKRRTSQTTSFAVGGAEGYLTAGTYDDQQLGEIFLKFGKQGSTLAGVMDAFSIAVSIGLQSGGPLETFVEKFTTLRFEPAGLTDDPDVRMAQSIMDYVFRRLALDYLDFDTRSAYGIYTAEERTRHVETGSYLPEQTEDDLEDDLASLAQSTPTTPSPAPKPAEPVAAKPVPVEVHSSAELVEKLVGHASDAPMCFTCGTKMRPAGSCYVCEGCGSTSGCS